MIRQRKRFHSDADFISLDIIVKQVKPPNAERFIPLPSDRIRV
jgi:hypothetical protein